MTKVNSKNIKIRKILKDYASIKNHVFRREVKNNDVFYNIYGRTVGGFDIYDECLISFHVNSKTFSDYPNIGGVTFRFFIYTDYYAKIQNILNNIS